METSAIAYQKIRRIGRDEATDWEDHLAVEEPLEIQLAYYQSEKKITKSISVTMRTPGHDRDLAIGFLFTEGIVSMLDQVESVKSAVLEENKVIVTLSDTFVPTLNALERNFYTTSSCGVCGKASIDAIKTVSAYQDQLDDILLTKEILFALSEKIAGQQNIFESTGGLHASSLFDLGGNFIMLREDVGRHNALDKLIGAAFLNNELPLAQNILLLSGRASFELIQKAAMAGIKVVAAIGAPSSLAVQLAEESSITLVGFLKNDRFNVYTGFGRVE
ncbi:MAG: formate dehydrogenase accessory sulfurtransferase FdhD [Dyadobacter sp.]|uniref:formate dehydrogenase accessory sulfurtransferase FdhD n=1 Tax=Dyadobacter sp. TaxID=1914288 RepID=UPI0032656B55